MTTQRRGRPAGSPPNRETILAAAREQFSALGYDAATIRGIAGAAGVDAALVHHYYGSKGELFAAALDLPMHPALLLEVVLPGPVEELGERLVRGFLDLWTGKNGDVGATIVALL